MNNFIHINSTKTKWTNLSKDKLLISLKNTLIYSLNRPISIKEIEFVHNNLLTKKTPGPEGSIGEF